MASSLPEYLGLEVCLVEDACTTLDAPIAVTTVRLADIDADPKEDVDADFDTDIAPDAGSGGALVEPPTDITVFKDISPPGGAPRETTCGDTAPGGSIVVMGGEASTGGATIGGEPAFAAPKNTGGGSDATGSGTMGSDAKGLRTTSDAAEAGGGAARTGGGAAKTGSGAAETATAATAGAACIENKVVRVSAPDCLETADVRD